MSGSSSIGASDGMVEKNRRPRVNRRRSARAAPSGAALGLGTYGVEKRRPPRAAASKRVRDCERSCQRNKGLHEDRRKPRGRSGRRVSEGEADLPRTDETDGHLIYRVGNCLQPSEHFPHGRYKILTSLGEGTFGKVVECWDKFERMRVAVKVVRNVKKYRDAANNEIQVLKHLRQSDPYDWYHCVRLFRSFDHRGHVCMVFEKLGPSLYEYLREKSFQPFTLNEVRTYAFQLLESVSLLHRLTLIHTDLKPENILLKDKNRPGEIKLIDFGSAIFSHRHHPTVISTRHYRAPEVILGLEWSYSCDLWSVGCVLLELFTGKALFPTHHNSEHLAMMSCTLGPFPDTMVRRADPYMQKYFVLGADDVRGPAWPVGTTPEGRMKSRRRVPRLSELVIERKGDANFLDLLQKLLTFEPNCRYTSQEALQHPFFQCTDIERQMMNVTCSNGSSMGGVRSNYMARQNYLQSDRPEAIYGDAGLDRGGRQRGLG